jgi:Flp pilus assembly pilin Flp
MNSVRDLLVKVLKEPDGGEVLEYALIAGLIVIAAIAAITVVGTNVLARWNTLSGASW